MSFLRKNFSALQDQDSLVGLTHFTSSSALSLPASIEEQLLDCETTLDWSSALRGYELLLQQPAGMNEGLSIPQLRYVQKVLECQKQLGQYTILTRQVEGVLAQV